MARNLGHTVTIEQLAINEEASNTAPAIVPITPIVPTQEKKDAKQPERDRKKDSSDVQREEQTPPIRSKGSTNRAKEHKEGRVINGTTRGKRIKQPDRSIFSSKRNSRRGAGRHPGFGRTRRMHEVYALAAYEPQYRATRRKPKATSVGRGGASKRSINR